MRVFDYSITIVADCISICFLSISSGLDDNSDLNHSRIAIAKCTGEQRKLLSANLRAIYKTRVAKKHS